MRPLLLLTALLALGACDALRSDVEVRRLFVDSRAVLCTGGGIQQCLRVRASPEAEWELFHDPIEGFTYEPGVAYELRVEVREVPDPPADGSSLRYRLLEIVSRTPAAG